jgi:hypothetical protein
VRWQDLFLAFWSGNVLQRPAATADGYYITGYGLIALASVLLILARSLTWAFSSVRASSRLHHAAVERLMAAGLSWCVGVRVWV